jgi:hypothetical protein
MSSVHCGLYSSQSGVAEDSHFLTVAGPLDCDVLCQAVPEEKMDCLPLKITIL